MMQIPSSNHSTCTSRRSNTKRASLARWFDGWIDKACCAAAPYSVGDEVVDDHSIAYSETSGRSAYTNENSYYHQHPHAYSSGYQQRNDRHGSSYSTLWEKADDSIQWMMDSKQQLMNATTTSSGSSTSFDDHYRPSKKSSNKKTTIYPPSSRVVTKAAQPPLSPRSDATATTVLTGSTNSSRGTNSHRQQQSSVSVSVLKQPHSPERAHSTGNIRRPEDEWYLEQQKQQEEQERLQRIQQQQRAGHPTREVLVPRNWTHKHGLRRMASDTHTHANNDLPKLPFQTVQQSSSRHYRRSNN